MKLSELKPNPKNPRKIIDESLLRLGKSVKKHGSLDGIVYNERTGTLEGGHQRQKLDPNAEVFITERLEQPDDQGTTAWGYVLIHGIRFPFRQVWWTEADAAAARLAANKAAGEWDYPILSDTFTYLDEQNYDLDLTMHSGNEAESIVAFIPPETLSEQPPTIAEQEWKELTQYEGPVPEMRVVIYVNDESKLSELWSRLELTQYKEFKKKLFSARWPQQQ